MFGRKKEPTAHSVEYIIVGLGNPGRQYECSRHNVGFFAIDALCKQLSVSCTKLKFKALYTDAVLNGIKVLLVKPQTFMNASGEAVRDIAAFYKVPIDRVLVIFDDVSLDVGKLRIRRKGSDGGHNGIKSIIYLTGKDDFPRIKIGVGQKPHPEYDLAKWVLSDFTKDDEKALVDILSRIPDAVCDIITGDIDKAMNKHNS